jgi:ribosome maturation factor RimP
MKDIVEKAMKLAVEEAQKLQLDIISVDYVHEQGMKILRVIAESDGGLTIDQSADLNRALCIRLDEVDFIDEEYYVEVSSVGLEQPIETPKDIEDAVGQYIYVHLYEKMDKKKEFYGDLIEMNDQEIVLNCNVKGQEQIIRIERKKISKMRHAVKF